jgi:hypothetical protein
MMPAGCTLPARSRVVYLRIDLGLARIFANIATRSSDPEEAALYRRKTQQACDLVALMHNRMELSAEETIEIQNELQQLREMLHTRDAKPNESEAVLQT